MKFWQNRFFNKRQNLDYLPYFNLKYNNKKEEIIVMPLAKTIDGLSFKNP